MPNIVAIMPVGPGDGERSFNGIRQLSKSGVTQVVCVLNGLSRDATLAWKNAANSFGDFVKSVWFIERLGHDVPRCAGIIQAMRFGIRPDAWLLIDGDFEGSYGPMLADFLAQSTDCAIGMIAQPPGLDEEFREWWQVWLPPLMGSCLHGAPFMTPLFIRSHLFEDVSAFWMHQPGKWYAYTMRKHPSLHVTVDSAWDARLTGHVTKSTTHQRLMRETLYGDWWEAVQIHQGRRPTRRMKSHTYLGVHPERRIDLLTDYAGQIFV